MRGVEVGGGGGGGWSEGRAWQWVGGGWAGYEGDGSDVFIILISVDDRCCSRLAYQL